MLRCPMCNEPIERVKYKNLKCKFCGEKLAVSHLTESTEKIDAEYLAIVGCGVVKTKPVKVPSFRKTCDAKTERPGSFGLGGFIRRSNQ